MYKQFIANRLTAWWTNASGSGLAGGELRFMFGDDALVIRVDEAERPSAVRPPSARPARKTSNHLGRTPIVAMSPGRPRLPFGASGPVEEREYDVWPFIRLAGRRVQPSTTEDAMLTT